METIRLQTEYLLHTCQTCGVPFAVTDGYDDRRREDGRTFYCPNGHSLTYRDTLHKQLTAAQEQLARERARHDQTRAERDAIERQRRATKGQLTKVRKRVANGVCPCCNRSFADLAAHMATKHPDYAKREHEAGHR
jgi:hypothetical protein